MNSIVTSEMINGHARDLDKGIVSRYTNRCGQCFACLTIMVVIVANILYMLYLSEKEKCGEL